MAKYKKIIFEVEPDEVKKAKKWEKKQMKKHGAEIGTIGDRFSYKFTQTGLGTIVSIVDNRTKEHKVLTNFDNW